MALRVQGFACDARVECLVFVERDPIAIRIRLNHALQVGALRTFEAEQVAQALRSLGAEEEGATQCANKKMKTEGEMWGLVAWVLVGAWMAYCLYRWWVVRSTVSVPFIVPLFPFLYCLPHTLLHYNDFYSGLAEGGLRLGTFAFYTPLLGQVWVFLREEKDAKYILEHVDTFPKGELKDHLKVFLGGGIFAADGAEWLAQVRRQKKSKKEKIVSDMVARKTGKKYNCRMFPDVVARQRKSASHLFKGKPFFFLRLIDCLG